MDPINILAIFLLVMAPFWGRYQINSQNADIKKTSVSGLFVIILIIVGAGIIGSVLMVSLILGITFISMYPSEIWNLIKKPTRDYLD